ncbi:MAG: polysaccharide biosynthesis tyrosine autokinase [Balneola sp.]|nr:MAG: polysaccharide biosynthesis tyrosine autokinase [Balneola sp.]
MHLNGSNGTPKNPSHIENNFSSEEREVDLLKLANLLLLNKWKIIAITSVFTIGAMIFSLSLTPIYSSSGTIIISESKNRYSYAGSDLSNLLTTTYGIGVGSTIANELQILRSVSLSYQLAEKILEIQKDETGNIYPIVMRSYPDNPVSTSVDTVAMRFRGLISFSQIDPEADLVRISFESPSPYEASEIVNMTMDTYSSISTDQNRRMAVDALTFLRGEKSKIQEQLEVVEDSLKTFMDQSQLIAVDPQTEKLIVNISGAEVERKEVEIALVAVNSSLEEYQQQLNEIKPGLANQYSEAFGAIIERYQFALSELETEKLLLEVKNPNITDEHSEIIRIQSQIDQFKLRIKSVTDDLLENDSALNLSFASRGDGSVMKRLAEISEKLIELEVEKTKYKTQLNFLNEYYESLNLEFEKLPNDIIELAKLQRNVKINEELFLLVSSQYAEMSLWEKTQFGLGRPLDKALVPLEPIKPRKKIITIIGFFFGGFLAVGFVLIRNLIDDKITSTDSIKDFKLPLLGTIPDFSILDGLDSNERQFIDDKSVSNQLITFLDHISPISEAYRRLRINVVYANPDKVHRVIMVTSATKGEGKSTLAANLAVTFSEAEKSVLLIDLDLRRPTQHKIFGENREPGLTDSLFETIKISDITRETIAPNVDLITVGKKTPEPATVLDSKRLKQLIDKLSERYDHIILDTAPYGIISDSASLLRLVDGIVVVSRFNVTTKRELKYTLEGLNHLNADVLGVVLNAFDPKRSTDYYTNYSYYKRTYSEYYQEEV